MSSTFAYASSNVADVLQRIQKMDRLQERVPANQRNDQLLQRILGQRDHTCQPDSPQPCDMDTAWPPWTMIRWITSYSESLANFGAAYAATQESMKAQATTMAAMQDQLTNIQQFCMAVGQQPPRNIYAPAQQQHTFNRCRDRCNGGGHNNSGVVVATMVQVSNNQPGLVAMVPALNNPHPTSMPLHSSSTLSTVAVTDAMAEATTTVGWWWQRWCKFPTTSLVWWQRCQHSTTYMPSHSLQALGKLELLPYSWW